MVSKILGCAYFLPSHVGPLGWSLPIISHGWQSNSCQDCEFGWEVFLDSTRLKANPTYQLPQSFDESASAWANALKNDIDLEVSQPAAPSSTPAAPAPAVSAPATSASEASMPTKPVEYVEVEADEDQEFAGAPWRKKRRSVTWLSCEV